MARYLITTVPQVNGGSREIYARTAQDAREARETLRQDPAMLDHVNVAEYVDVDRDGT
jgi:hypothetical protein